METDIAPVDPVQGEEVNFQGLRPDPYATEEPLPPQLNQEHKEDPEYFYYNPPQVQQPLPPPPLPQATNDIFSSMDRTTWILLIIAFVVGFFMGRGMIQPVILRSGH